MKTNKDKLPKMSLNARVDHPKIKGYYTGFDGQGVMMPGTGGITYNAAIGDNCMNPYGDHIEPGVSMANPSNPENQAVQFYSCVGNEVEILSGPLAGSKGMVTGTHGGVDHTMAWFEPEIIEKMNGKEDFLIRGYGQGLESESGIRFMNLDPDLLEAMDLQEDEQGNLLFPVAAIVDSKLIGAGLGTSNMKVGDFDLMLQDKSAKESLKDLRYGDFIAIQDLYTPFGPHYKQDAMTIGVVVHSDSYSAGHGPGITVLVTDDKGRVQPVLDKEANLSKYIGFKRHS